MATKKVTKAEPRISRTEPLANTTDVEEPKLKQEVKVEADGAEDSETDYLQKWQYGRELPLGDIRTNPQGESKAMIMKRSLLLQGKIRILVPVDSGSDPSVPFSVCLNGYRLDLPRNQYIDVPEQVAEMVMNSHKQTQIALNHQSKITGNKEKETALL